MFAEKRFVKEKICRLIVEMAKRDWPQRWIDFLDILLAMMTRNEVRNTLYSFKIISMK